MRTSLIRTKIKEIEDSLQVIKEYLPGDVEDFIALGIVKDGIYTRLEFCIETVFDIRAVLNTDCNLGIPGNDEGVVDNMIRSKILPGGVRAKLAAMKGFRNIVVRRYGKLDDPSLLAYYQSISAIFMSL